MKCRDRGGLWRVAEVAFAAGLLIAVSVVLSGVAARRPLWYDELFSFYIASLPTLGAVLSALLDGAEIWPPLDFLVRHVSMDAFGRDAWGMRLPSIIAMAGFMMSLAAFARRHMSRAASATVFVLPLATFALGYGAEARGYTLLLFSASLSLLAWQRTLESPRGALWPVILTVSLAAGPLSHLYGVLNYLPVAVGEAVRLARQRRVSAGVLVSFGISLGALAVLPLFARHAMDVREFFWARPAGFGSLWPTYRQLLGDGRTPALVLMLAAGGSWVARSLGWRAHQTPTATGACAHAGPPPWESAAAVTLALTPVLVWVMAVVYTNAAVARYGMAAVAGFALLAGEGLGVVERLGRVGRYVAWAVCALVLGLGLAEVYKQARFRWEVPIPADVTRLVLQSAEPVAVDNPLLYLQTYYYLPPAAKAKLVYPVDREASVRYKGFANDDVLVPNLRKAVPGLRTMSYAEFRARERQFTVLAHENRYWLLARLADEGAQITPVGRFGQVEVFRVVLP